MPRLEDRVCIVTGAGCGIGAAVARVLASEGARVVVNDIGGNLDGSGGGPWDLAGAFALIEHTFRPAIAPGNRCGAPAAPQR